MKGNNILDTENSPRVTATFAVEIPSGEFKPEASTIQVEASGWLQSDGKVLIDTLMALHVQQGEYLVLPKASRMRTEFHRIATKILRDAKA